MTSRWGSSYRRDIVATPPRSGRGQARSRQVAGGKTTTGRRPAPGLGASPRLTRGRRSAQDRGGRGPRPRTGLRHPDGPRDPPGVFEQVFEQKEQYRPPPTVRQEAAGLGGSRVEVVWKPWGSRGKPWGSRGDRSSETRNARVPPGDGYPRRTWPQPPRDRQARPTGG